MVAGVVSFNRTSDGSSTVFSFDVAPLGFDVGIVICHLRWVQMVNLAEKLLSECDGLETGRLSICLAWDGCEDIY